MVEPANQVILDYHGLRRVVIEVLIIAYKDSQRKDKAESAEATEWIQTTGRDWADILKLDINI
jgi:hypothetical protein